MIYFIQQGTGGAIKIGVSDNPQKRMAQLQTGNPHKLRLLYAGPGGVVREMLIHLKLRRFRMNGEWFSPSPEVLDFVNYLCNRGGGHDLEGEVVERGDSIGFRYKGKWIYGTVETNPTNDNDDVMVTADDGRVLWITCNKLLVYHKRPAG